eukprot:GHVP01050571.1.p1 GENE.GHVP01050571.1~~GHVP01050571.1.p1  ORF type:complete len:670 (+),score=88.28 GHVP01050571.1:55-2064(+)
MSQSSQSSPTELEASQSIFIKSARSVSSIAIPGNKGVVVEFKNLTLDVEVVRTANNPCERFKNCCSKPPIRRIMNDVSGTILPGDCVALMGASGAGKSTLLNILSRRIRSNTGEITYNGIPADNSLDLTTNSCFIQQQDIFMGFLNVEEHLTTQSKMRLPISDEKRKERTDDIIELFGMNKIRQGKIGNLAQGAKKGISGGEKKRLSIGSELLTNPAIIFADEPTSGLDAFLAESVVDVLQGLAASGHTIITTIHQPSSQVFQKFNKLLLLSEGEMLFFGPRNAAIPYFARLGQIVPQDCNPADFYIETLAINWEDPDAKIEELRKWREYWGENSGSFLEEWETSLKHKLQIQEEKVDDSIKAALAEMNESFELPKGKNGLPVPVSGWDIFKALTKRSWIMTIRDPGIVRMRLFHLICIIIVLSSVYFRLDDTAVHSKSGACFSIMITSGMPATLSVITAFVNQKPIVLREKDASIYSLITFYVSKLTSDFPFQLLLPTVFTTIIWYCIGLNDDPLRWLEAVWVSFLSTQALTSFGYFVAAVAPTVAVALALAPLVLLPFFIVSGFVISLDSLAPFWIWLEVISPIRYGFAGMMIAVFKDTTIDANCPVIGGQDNILAPCYGNTVLDSFQIDPTYQFYNWIILIGLIIALRAIGGLAFWVVNRKGSKGQ